MTMMRGSAPTKSTLFLVALILLCNFQQQHLCQKVSVSEAAAVDVNYDRVESFHSGIEGEVNFPELDRRMEAFIRTVCDKCLRRKVVCGCDLSPDQNPAFARIRQFAAKQARWGLSLRAGENVQRKWIIVHAEGGAGNQMIQIVGAMLLAMAMDRGLAVQYQSLMDYDFDPVFDIVSPGELPQGLSVIEHSLFSAEAVRSIVCGDWEEEFGRHDVLNFVGAFSVHLPLLNPRHGPLLNSTFHGLPFFFLSHFLWGGAKQMAQKARIQSLPTPLPWDSSDTLEEFFSQLDVHRRGRLVVGMHVRVDTNHQLYYHDNTHLIPNHPEKFCAGDAGGLLGMLECLKTIIGKAGKRSEEGVIVLWATDNDQVSLDLLEGVLKVASAVVKLRFAGGHDRHDVNCWHIGCESTGLLDLEFLGLADEMIVSPSSTYSFSAHARALIPPHFGAYTPNGRVCEKAPGPEVGLLMRDGGKMHTQCTMSGEDIMCDAQKEGCIGLFSAHFHLGGCLQDIAPCADWSRASPYIASLSHGLMLQASFARYGYHFHAPYPHYRIPACKGAPQERVKDIAAAANGGSVSASSYARGERYVRGAYGSVWGAIDDQDGTSWTVKARDVGVFAFSSPSSITSVHIHADQFCPSHHDEWSLWYTSTSHDPQMGRSCLGDALTLSFMATWHYLGSSPSEHTAFNEGILDFTVSLPQNVTATAIKIQAAKICAHAVKRVRVLGVPTSTSSSSPSSSKNRWIMVLQSPVLKIKQDAAGGIAAAALFRTHVELKQPLSVSEHAECYLRYVVSKAVGARKCAVEEVTSSQEEERVRAEGVLPVPPQDVETGAFELEFEANVYEIGDFELSASLWEEGAEDATVTLHFKVGAQFAPTQTEPTTLVGATVGETVGTTASSGRAAALDDGGMATDRDVHVSGTCRGSNPGCEDWATADRPEHGQGAKGGGTQKMRRRHVVYSFITPNLLFFIFQVRAWRRFCEEKDIEFVAVIHQNVTKARWLHTRSSFSMGAVRATCSVLGVPLVVVPYDIGTTENHQVQLEWLWHNIVIPKHAKAPHTVIITEGDMLPYKNFSIASLMDHGTCTISGVSIGNHSDGWYYHPNLQCFDMLTMPKPEYWCFSGINVSKPGGNWLFDTGGCSYLYLARFQRQTPTRVEQSSSHVLTPLRPQQFNPEETTSLLWFFRQFSERVERGGVWGFSDYLASCPAYSDFDKAMEGEDAASVCTLKKDQEFPGLESLPSTCGGPHNQLMSGLQRSYCDELSPDDKERTPLRITEARTSAGPFLHVACGSGWCGPYNTRSDMQWRLASSDLALMYVQQQFGCECVQCAAAESLLSSAWNFGEERIELQTVPFLIQPQCT